MARSGGRMTTRTITLPVTHAYALARRVMETRIWEHKTRAPWPHAADIATDLLQQSPLLARPGRVGTVGSRWFLATRQSRPRRRAGGAERPQGSQFCPRFR